MVSNEMDEKRSSQAKHEEPDGFLDRSFEWHGWGFAGLAIERESHSCHESIASNAYIHERYSS